MRKTANVSRPDAEFRRAMIYDPEDGGGVSLFLFRTPDDEPCEADYWYEHVADAERHAADGLGIRAEDWRSVPDPEPGHWDDRLSPDSTVQVDPGRPEGRQAERPPG